MADQIYLTWLARPSIDEVTWNQCVSESPNALLYGYTWYLDAVTDTPGWRWEGLVLPHESGVGYAAVMPVPLRKRWGRWVIYQPLFCQFLAIFAKNLLDPAPFLEALARRHRYASSLNLCLAEPLPILPDWIKTRTLFTHVLPLTHAQSQLKHQPIPHDDIVAGYTADRRMNQRRAVKRTSEVVDYQLADSDNIEPLLDLFRQNHAETIGVGEWMYALFRKLFVVLRVHGVGTLRYVCVSGTPVAGALFVDASGRIIYLFNAGNAEGRRLNARTLLLDEAIRAGTKKPAAGPLVFDFESPDIPGVVSFYESFGATPQAYTVLTWNRLTWLEKRIQAVRRLLKASV